MNHEGVKVVGDAISLGIIIGTIAKILPAIAALASIIWYCVLILDRFKKK